MNYFEWTSWAFGFLTYAQKCQYWHFRLYCVKTKKIQWQNVTPSGNRTWASHSLWFQVRHSLFYTNLTFACKTKTWVSIYSIVMLYLSPLNHHEQKLKDLLSSTCPVSVERRVLDLESEAMRALGGFPQILAQWDPLVICWDTCARLRWFK